MVNWQLSSEWPWEVDKHWESPLTCVWPIHPVEGLCLCVALWVWLLERVTLYSAFRDKIQFSDSGSPWASMAIFVIISGSYQETASSNSCLSYLWTALSLESEINKYDLIFPLSCHMVLFGKFTQKSCIKMSIFFVINAWFSSHPQLPSLARQSQRALSSDVSTPLYYSAIPDTRQLICTIPDKYQFSRCGRWPWSQVMGSDQKYLLLSKKYLLQLRLVGYSDSYSMEVHFTHFGLFAGSAELGDSRCDSCERARWTVPHSSESHRLC